jgi:hypothetical protein
MNKRAVILILLVLIIADLSFGQGCSQCKLVAEQGSNLEESSYASNINYGILFLVAIPYIIIFTVFHKPIIQSQLKFSLSCFEQRVIQIGITQ